MELWSCVCVVGSLIKFIIHNFFLQISDSEKSRKTKQKNGSDDNENKDTEFCQRILFLKEQQNIRNRIYEFVLSLPHHILPYLIIIIIIIALSLSLSLFLLFIKSISIKLIQLLIKKTYINLAHKYTQNFILRTFVSYIYGFYSKKKLLWLIHHCSKFEMNTPVSCLSYCYPPPKTLCACVCFFLKHKVIIFIYSIRMENFQDSIVF